jgi:transaldolase
MSKTKIEQLTEYGQSAWLDSISRVLIETGKLKEMIRQGLRGMTSNPTIFDKAISSGDDYDQKIKELSNAGKLVFEIYDELTVRDVQGAADIFMPVYQETRGLDGYVSLEINPKLAFKTQETIEEGKRLCKKVNRTNVMFKVPATEEGFKAIEELIACEININVTLIFSLEQYINAAQAYIRGIKRILQNKGDASKVRSVASVFVSRIDTAVDNLLEEVIVKEETQQKKIKLSSLKGKTAAANANLIYEKYLEISTSSEFKQIHDKGAQFQRVLWGSTSTKNPAYSDIKYVTELIAKNTVNTLPENTFEAFLDHGIIKETLISSNSDAQNIINSLEGFGISVNKVLAKLLHDGVVSFEKSFVSLLHSIEEKM